MKMNRRDFLKNMAVVGGAAALVGLAGCAGTSALDGHAWDEEYDIVIVGGGGGGFISAIAAADANPSAKILIVEKMGQPGGSSTLSGGNIGAFDTDVLEAAAAKDPFYGNDTLDMYYNDKLAAGDYLSDPDLAHFFVYNSHDNYEWLKSLGITWTSTKNYEMPVYLPSAPSRSSIIGMSGYLQNYDDAGAYNGINQKCRFNSGSTYGDLKAGTGNMQCLYDTFANYPNATLVTSTELTRIVRKSQYEGDVQGIVVRDEADKEKYIRAKRAVILASGGFAANSEMMHLHNGKVSLNTQATGGRGNTGDGIIAAQYVGAQTVNMDAIQMEMSLTTSSSADAESTSPSRNPFAGPANYIEVGPDGKRMWGEMSDNIQYYEAKLTRLMQLGGIDTWWKLGDATSILGKKPTQADLDDFAKHVGKICNSVNEVAGVIGCDANTLQQTIDRYNGFVETKIDSDFGKSTKLLTQKIETPPYYVFAVTYYCRSTPGGLRINTDAQVIDLNGNPIPRLYGVGEVTGNVHGRYRNNGGDSWTDFTCFGRIAGTNAVALTPAE